MQRIDVSFKKRRRYGGPCSALAKIKPRFPSKLWGGERSGAEQATWDYTYLPEEIETRRRELLETSFKQGQKGTPHFDSC